MKQVWILQYIHKLVDQKIQVHKKQTMYNIANVLSFMGTNIKKIGNAIGKKFQQMDNFQNNGIPRDIEKNNQQAQQLNKLLFKNKYSLGVQVKILTENFVRNGLVWQKSIMRGIVKIIDTRQNKQQKNQQVKQQQIIKSQKKQNNQPQKQEGQQNLQANLQKGVQKEENVQNVDQQHKNQQNEKDIQKKKESSSTVNIVVTLQDIYQLKALLLTYDEFLNQQKQMGKTPGGGDLCVICFEIKPEQVLPCAHSYCRKCIQKYIMKQNLQCPMCRKQYRQSLSNNTYQIIQLDQNFISQMQNQFFKILKKNNEKQTKIIKHKLKKMKKFESSVHHQ